MVLFFASSSMKIFTLDFHQSFSPILDASISVLRLIVLSSYLPSQFLRCFSPSLASSLIPSSSSASVPPCCFPTPFSNASPSTSFLSTQSCHLIETFFLFASAKSAAYPIPVSSSEFRVLQFWPSPDSYPRCKHQNCSITVSTKVAISFACLLPCIKSPKHQKLLSIVLCSIST